MHKLIAYGTDITDRCDDKVANTDYSDGRNSFTFVSPDGTVVITFSGDGKRQVHPDPNTAVQPLDAVLARFNGKTDTIRAVGTCRFTNPYNGKAPVQCSAETPQGEFAASFTSNGQAPDLERGGCQTVPQTRNDEIDEGAQLERQATLLVGDQMHRRGDRLVGFEQQL